jgi:O-antigen/teichoic acid export membrane protein
MLALKTLLGAGWTVSARLAGRGIDFITVLVLARTLLPADFGLTAIAMTLISIVDTVLEVPLILALISLSHVKKAHLDTAFTLGAIRGLILSLVVLAAAWPFSRIYHDERLILLVSALALAPISRSLYNPRMVNFLRDMSFRQGFIAEMVGKIIASALAMSVMYLGGGYWAIATNSIVSSAATTLISYIIISYRPVLSLSKFSEYSKFLGWFSTAQVFSALSWQYDRIVLGYSLSKSDLGQYAMASDLSALPTQSLIGPAMQPLVAAFSKISDDRERLRSAYSKASRFTMMLAAPTCIGISLTSDLIVNVMLGAKWSEAALYLQWMAIAVVFSAFYQPLHSLSLATNRTDVIFRLSMVEVCSKIILVPVGLYFYSVMGVIATRVAIALIMFILTLFAARYLVGTRVISEVLNLWKVMTACTAMILVVLLMRHALAGHDVNSFIALVCAAGCGGIIYAGTLFALGVRSRASL